MTLTSQGRSVVGADRRACRQWHGDAGRRGDRRPQSARLRDRHPRQRRRPGRPTTTRLRQLVEPALSAGRIAVASAQIPFTIRDGRLRVGATRSKRRRRGHRLRRLDIPADQADIRASLTPIMTGLSGAPPEIQLFAAGPPTGSAAPSISRRCRRGLRCGRSIARREGWMRSSAASPPPATAGAADAGLARA